MNDIFEILIASINEASVKINAFSNSRIFVTSKNVHVIPLTVARIKHGYETTPIHAVAMSLIETPPIMFAMVLTEDARCHVVESMHGHIAVLNEEMSNSILQEFCTILGTSLSNYISKYLNRISKISLPEVIKDVPESAFNNITSTFKCTDDQILFIDIVMNVRGKNVNFSTYLLFDENIAEELLEKTV